MSVIPVDTRARSGFSPAAASGWFARGATDPLKAVRDLGWPEARLGEAIEELALKAGLRPAAAEPLIVPEELARLGGAEFDRWITWAGDRLGVEAEAIEATAAGLDQLLAGAGPALIRFRDADGPRFLLLLAPRFGLARLIAPDHSVRSCRLDHLAAVVAAAHEAPMTGEIDRLLDLAAVAAPRRSNIRSIIARERLGAKPIGGIWALRLPASAGLFRQFGQIRVPRTLMVMAGLFVAVYALEILGWSVIGDAALNGRFDLGWLAAWSLVVLSIVPLRLCAGWLNASLAIDVGRLIKTRLLVGGLRIDIEAMRRDGAGQMLARVMESQAFEALAVNGGLAALVALVELAFSAWLLAAGAGGTLHVGLLLVWLLITVGLSLRYFRGLDGWTAMRLDLTHGLVERMVGHRTVLAQEAPERGDAEQDRSMKDYLAASIGLDRSVMPFLVGAPGGWMILGLIGLAPAFVAQTASPGALAVGLGGVLFAGRALGSVASGLAAAARAVIAWRQIAPLHQAAATPAQTGPFVANEAMRGAERTGPAARLIDADSLTYRYRPSAAPVLRGASLSIDHGERLLIEGGSGGGKSTLAAVLTGLRQPESGLLLLNGLDRHTLGDAWHRFATSAPQFHENHILGGTLGFNLLMGRAWPASEEDMAEARALCVELGLSDLLARMPSGLMQTVGETGWQLSHGERSRIFLARALLQDAELTILDESFAALDPETLDLCLACAFRRAKTLIVIAHP